MRYLHLYLQVLETKSPNFAFAGSCSLLGYFSASFLCI